MNMERPLVPGIIIDSPGTRKFDDAVWIESAGGGWHALISIFDYGYFQTQYASGNQTDVLHSFLCDGAKTITVQLDFNKTNSHPKISVFPAQLQCLGQATYNDSFQASFLPDDMRKDWVDAAIALFTRRQDSISGTGLTVSRLTQPQCMTAFRANPFGAVQASFIVAELMIAASSAVAEWAYRKALPFVFFNNVSSEPDRTFHDTQNYGFSRLGVEHYCKFTSPLRRSADKINHRILWAHFENQDLPYSRQSLASVCVRLNRHAPQTVSPKSEEKIFILTGQDSAEALNFFCRSHAIQPKRIYEKRGNQVICETTIRLPDKIDIRGFGLGKGRKEAAANAAISIVERLRRMQRIISPPKL